MGHVCPVSCDWPSRLTPREGGGGALAEESLDRPARLLHFHLASHVAAFECPHTVIRQESARHRVPARARDDVGSQGCGGRTLASGVAPFDLVAQQNGPCMSAWGIFVAVVGYSWAVLAILGRYHPSFFGNVFMANALRRRFCGGYAGRRRPRWGTGTSARAHTGHTTARQAGAQQNSPLSC